MSAHTPGPWNYYALLSGSENHHGYRIQDKDGWIADCSPRDEDGKEGGANARLISAAPDLFAALQYCESVLSDLSGTQVKGTRVRKAFEECRAAIAKVQP